MSSDLSQLPVTVDDVQAARQRIAPWVVATPLVECEGLSQRLGCKLRFKCENLQHVGAFKSRGACNAVFLLSDEEAARGVVTHSSGNHAAALARAAMLRGAPAHIVMPHNSNKKKIAAVRAFGVEPVFCEPDAQSRQQAAEQLRRQTDALMVHPYNDRRIIAGQGTVALEILEQWPEVDTIVTPVGGGGLLSGTLITVKSLRAAVRVIAAEPAWADDAARSLQSGKLEPPTRYDTVADGLRTPLGDLTFPIIQRLLDDILLVEEDTIVDATRLIASSARLVAEPSGAVALAAMIERPEHFRGRNVAAVISGGNLDLDHFKL